MSEQSKDWYKEISLKSGEEMQSNWWSPEPNKYEVTFMKEPSEPFEVEYDGKKRTKVAIEISVNNESFVWSVTESQGETSIFGQLVKLAHKHKGLTGVTTQILVQGINKERRYVIPEVVDYSIEP